MSKHDMNDIGDLAKLRARMAFPDNCRPVPGKWLDVRRSTVRLSVIGWIH
jgi:hypothetical protein